MFKRNDNNIPFMTSKNTQKKIESDYNCETTITTIIITTKIIIKESYYDYDVIKLTKWKSNGRGSVAKQQQQQQQQRW